MSDNPLEDDPDREKRISDRAYHLWQADGEPHGRHDEYWERASELVRMEEAGRVGQLPNPTTIPGHDPTRPEPIEEASIQENLGEFPDRFADQGEATPTPKPKRVARARLAEEDRATGAAGPAADAEPKAKAGKKPAKAAEPVAAADAAKKSRKKA
ncbi:MAG: DUF2934 domain-containing protein [Gluconacetobacter diazotrophicus]|nr:DUF2934 domain-containing protein [Gluconacetobacter diazotrophicus]